MVIVHKRKAKWSGNSTPLCFYMKQGNETNVPVHYKWSEVTCIDCLKLGQKEYEGKLKIITSSIDAIKVQMTKVQNDKGVL